MTTDEMTDRYRAGESLRDIAAAANVTHAAVRKRLLRAGVKMRASGFQSPVAAESAPAEKKGPPKGKRPGKRPPRPQDPPPAPQPRDPVTGAFRRKRRRGYTGGEYGLWLTRKAIARGELTVQEAVDRGWLLP